MLTFSEIFAEAKRRIEVSKKRKQKKKEREKKKKKQRREGKETNESQRTRKYVLVRHSRGKTVNLETRRPILI